MTTTIHDMETNRISYDETHTKTVFDSDESAVPVHSHPPPGIRCLPRLRVSLSTRTRLYQLYIAIFTFVIYTSYHISRKPLSVVKNVLHVNQSTNVSHSWRPFDSSNYLFMLGSLDYAFLFSYSIFIYISGYMAERIDARYFLTFGMIMSGLFTAAFGFGYFLNIHVFTYFLFVQIFAGAFSSTGWPSVVQVMGYWFGKQRRGVIMCIWNSHTNVGNILGSVLAGVWVSEEWGLSFIIPAIIIIVLGILCFLFLVPSPEHVNCQPHQVSHLVHMETPLVSPKPATSSKSKAVTFCGALQIPGVIEYSTCLFFGKLVSYTFLYWLPQYIHSTTDNGAENSAYLSALFDVGGIVGGIAAGSLSDAYSLGTTSCATMYFLCAPLMLVYSHLTSLTNVTNSVFLFIMGFLINGPYALITTAVSADLGSHKTLRETKAIATVTAIIDGTGSWGAAIGPLLTGIIANYGWPPVFYMLTVADLIASLILVRLVIKEITSFRQRQTRS